MAAQQTTASSPPPPSLTVAANEDPHAAWANAAKWTAPAADELPPLDIAPFAAAPSFEAQLAAPEAVLAAAGALQQIAKRSEE